MTGHHASLHIHIEGDEDICDEPRAHMKYMGVVYSYIPDSSGSSDPGGTHRKVYPKLEVL